jgi:IS30 family transposase
MPGRHTALDNEKRSAICSLVAFGVSLRQAANYIGCAPKSIRREIERNDEFRASLAKARSEARMQPLETLRQAAKTNWRAALTWIERLEPDHFANPTESIITKREANRFVDELIESIGQAVKDPGQRQDLFDLLRVAMPLAMRRRWEGDAMGRAVDQMKLDVNERNRVKSVKEDKLEAARNRRRDTLFEEIAEYLPPDMRSKLWNNRDLLDPEKVFAQKP